MPEISKTILTAMGALAVVGYPAYILNSEIGRLRNQVDHARELPSRREWQEVRDEVNRLADLVAEQKRELNQLAQANQSTRSRRIILPAGQDQVAVDQMVVDLSGGLVTGFSPGGKLSWDHSQATGEPDTPRAGDCPTAWAPREQRSGEQWLQVGYENVVEAKEIIVHETCCPGAITKAAAVDADGKETTLWEGEWPAGDGSERRKTSLPVKPGTTTKQIRLYVDTNRVNSWPEIDAVELIGADDSRQWAKESSASSSYSERYSNAVPQGLPPGVPPPPAPDMPVKRTSVVLPAAPQSSPSPANRPRQVLPPGVQTSSPAVEPDQPPPGVR